MAIHAERAPRPPLYGARMDPCRVVTSLELYPGLALALILALVQD